MEEKFCNGCQKLKLVSEFWLKRGKPQSRCKDCQKVYHKLHYKDNKERYMSNAKKRNKIITDQIKDLVRSKKDIPCQDCNVKYPYYVMDFDHRPGEKKLFRIGYASWAKIELETILKEINKCDAVCANCHRIRTYNRLVSRDTQVV